PAAQRPLADAGPSARPGGQPAEAGDPPFSAGARADGAAAWVAGPRPFADGRGGVCPEASAPRPSIPPPFPPAERESVSVERESVSERRSASFHLSSDRRCPQQPPLTIWLAASEYVHSSFVRFIIASFRATLEARASSNWTRCVEHLFDLFLQACANAVDQ